MKGKRSVGGVPVPLDSIFTMRNRQQKPFPILISVNFAHEVINVTEILDAECLLMDFGFILSLACPLKEKKKKS